MANAIEFEKLELRCDAPGCDHAESIDVTDRPPGPEYVNKPCPKCGANLLTARDHADYLVFHAMMMRVNAAVGPMSDAEVAAAEAAGDVHDITVNPHAGDLNLEVRDVPKPRTH